jgi:hypothetical protein
MKQKLLTAWRILVSVGMVGVLIIAGILISLYYQEHKRYHRDSYSYTNRYSDTYKCEYNYNKGSVRLKSTETGKYLTPELSNIYDETVVDTLTVFFQKNKRGFLNIYTGQIEIPAQYEKAWIFSEGLGAVVKDNKLGFINKTGETVIPFQFAWKNLSGQKGEYLFKDGYCAVFDASGKQGIIDKAGKWIIDPQYDYIYAPKNGYRIVYKENKYGLLDNSMQLTLPVEYDKITLSNEGVVLRKGNDQKLIAYDFKTIIYPFVYDELNDIYYNSGKVNEEGTDIYVLSDYKKFSIGDKYGLIDKNGHITVPALYGNITAIHNDLFSCSIIGADVYITITGKGEVVK